MDANPKRIEPNPTVAAVLATRPALIAGDPPGAADHPAAGRPKITALVVDRSRRGSAAGRWAGHRPDNRQRRSENADCRRAFAPHARAKFDSYAADHKDSTLTECRASAPNY